MDPYTYVSDNPETFTDPTGLSGQQQENIFENIGRNVEGYVEQNPEVLIDPEAALEGAANEFIAGVAILGISSLTPPTNLGNSDISPVSGASVTVQPQVSTQAVSLTFQKPTKAEIKKARKILNQLEQERNKSGRSNRSKLELSNNDSFTHDSYRDGGGSPQESPQYGRDRGGRRGAYCGEAKCMQEADDKYGKNPPVGRNTAWETQKNGEEPCLYQDPSSGGCTLGFRNFSKKFVTTQVALTLCEAASRAG